MSSLLKQYLDVSHTEEAKPPSQISSTEEMSNSEHVDDQNIQEEEAHSNEQQYTKPQFKNVVAIVDPPRPGLHPDVIKALRTHPRLKTLVLVPKHSYYHHQFDSCVLFFSSSSNTILQLQVHIVQP